MVLIKVVPFSEVRSYHSFVPDGFGYKMVKVCGFGNASYALDPRHMYVYNFDDDRDCIIGDYEDCCDEYFDQGWNIVKNETHQSTLAIMMESYIIKHNLTRFQAIRWLFLYCNKEMKLVECRDTIDEVMESIRPRYEV